VATARRFSFLRCRGPASRPHTRQDGLRCYRARGLRLASFPPPVRPLRGLPDRCGFGSAPRSRGTRRRRPTRPSRLAEGQTARFKALTDFRVGFVSRVGAATWISAWCPIRLNAGLVLGPPTRLRRGRRHPRPPAGVADLLGGSGGLIALGLLARLRRPELQAHRPGPPSFLAGRNGPARTQQLGDNLSFAAVPPRCPAGPCLSRRAANRCLPPKQQRGACKGNWLTGYPREKTEQIYIR